VDDADVIECRLYSNENHLRPTRDVTGTDLYLLHEHCYAVGKHEVKWALENLVFFSKKKFRLVIFPSSYVVRFLYSELRIGASDIYSTKILKTLRQFEYNKSCHKLQRATCKFEYYSY